MSERIENIVVFRTGQLFEIDMASNVLKDNRIPHFTREENSGGLRLAMSVAPSTGPGVWWCLLVPSTHVDEAKAILEALPFCQGTDPGVWGFNPRPGVKLGWKIYITLVLLFTLVIWLARFV